VAPAFWEGDPPVVEEAEERWAHGPPERALIVWPARADFTASLLRRRVAGPRDGASHLPALACIIAS